MMQYQGLSVPFQKLEKAESDLRLTATSALSPKNIKFILIVL